MENITLIFILITLLLFNFIIYQYYMAISFEKYIEHLISSLKNSLFYNNIKTSLETKR